MMKKKVQFSTLNFIVFCALLLMTTTVEAQIRISGQVKDNSGNPLPYSSIFIENTIDGSTSDSLGKYNFTTHEKGKKVLVASFIGYETKKDTIILDKKVIIHDMILKEHSVAMQEVVVTAGSFEANNERVVTVLKPLDIYTNAGAGGDIMGAIRTLPGAQAQSDQTGLFVRGGDANESTVIIDGMVVQNPFSTDVPGVSQRSRFTPFQFKGMSFSSGGYGAKYGQALSSILELNTFDMPDNNNANLSVGLTGVAASGTIKWKSSAVELTGHYDNATPFYSLANTNFHFYEPPTGGGFSAKYMLKNTEKDLLKIFIKYDVASSGTDIPSPFNPDTIIPYGLHNSNVYFNSSYMHRVGKLVVRTSISGSNNEDKIHWGDSLLDNKDWRMQGRAEASYAFSGKLNLLVGTELQRYQFDQNFDTMDLYFNELLTAGYAELEWKPAVWFALKPGIRYEYSNLIEKSSLGPRLALAIGTGKYSQISLAGGIYFEDPAKKYLMVGYHPDFQKAVHYIANYQLIKNDRTFRIEAYYKSYNQLVRELHGYYDPNPYRFVYGPFDNSGSGYAQGVEIFWRDKALIHNFDYWISYSYIDTKRLYENFLYKTTPGFVSNHNLNILAKYFIDPLQINIGVSYTYASGKPYYNPQKTSSSDFMSDRTPDYNDLSMNLSYLLTVGRYFAVAYISIDNITNNKNIYGYRYSSDGTKHAVEPALYRWIYAGFTISLTKFSKEEL
jgi:hypothetical protein